MFPKKCGHFDSYFSQILHFLKTRAHKEMLRKVINLC